MSGPSLVLEAPSWHTRCDSATPRERGEPDIDTEAYSEQVGVGELDVAVHINSHNTGLPGATLEVEVEPESGGMGEASETLDVLWGGPGQVPVFRFSNLPSGGYVVRYTLSGENPDGAQITREGSTSGTLEPEQPDHPTGFDVTVRTNKFTVPTAPSDPPDRRIQTHAIIENQSTIPRKAETVLELLRDGGVLESYRFEDSDYHVLFQGDKDHNGLIYIELDTVEYEICATADASVTTSTECTTVDWSEGVGPDPPDAPDFNVSIGAGSPSVGVLVANVTVSNDGTEEGTATLNVNRAASGQPWDKQTTSVTLGAGEETVEEFRFTGLEGGMRYDACANVRDESGRKLDSMCNLVWVRARPPGGEPDPPEDDPPEDDPPEDDPPEDGGLSRTAVLAAGGLVAGGAFVLRNRGGNR